MSNVYSVISEITDTQYKYKCTVCQWVKESGRETPRRAAKMELLIDLLLLRLNSGAALTIGSTEVGWQRGFFGFWVLRRRMEGGRHTISDIVKNPKKRTLFLLFTPSAPPAPELEKKFLQIKTGPFPSYLRPIQPPLGPPLIPSLPLFKGDLFRGRKERRAFCPPPTFLKDALSWKKGRETTV